MLLDAAIPEAGDIEIKQSTKGGFFKPSRLLLLLCRHDRRKPRFGGACPLLSELLPRDIAAALLGLEFRLEFEFELVLPRGRVLPRDVAAALLVWV